MSSADLIREVKYRAKIDRDSELAKQIGVGRANVSAWLKGITKPDGIAMLKLTALGKLSAEEALFLVTQKPEEQSTALIPYSESLYIMLNRRLRDFSEYLHFVDRRHYS